MNLAGALASSCVQLFWPAHCAGCDVLLHSDAAVFCGTCALSINPMGLTCAGCAMPGSGSRRSGGRRRCSGCAQRDFAFSRAFAAFEYGAAMATAIVRMKHGGRPDLARRLGWILQDTLARALVGDGDGHAVDAIVPVPLHPRKLRQRGFNQALVITRAALGRLRDCRSRAAAKSLPAFERRLLLRVRNTRELGRAGPAARSVEVFGAFGISDPARVVGRRFLVVDDVMTTGATLNECAETLIHAGAAEVRVVALARAI